MLKAHSEIITSCELRSEKAANLEEVLLIKLHLKYSLSIFAIAHLQNLDGAKCHIRPSMANAQLTQIKVRIALNALFDPAWQMPS